jgi:hypothetical protein
MNIRSMYRRPFVYTFGQVLGNSVMSFLRPRRTINISYPIERLIEPVFSPDIFRPRAEDLAEARREEAERQKIERMGQTVIKTSPKINPKTDPKPVFASCYSSRPAMVRANGGLRGSSATRRRR